MDPDPDKQKTGALDHNVRTIGAATGATVALGIAAALTYSASVCDAKPWCPTLVFIGPAAAALVAGAFAGFLFGIPRYAAHPASTVVTQIADQAASDPTGFQPDAPPVASPPLYASNTNLEQVSDWLTKIILGATLTQVTKLPHFLRQLGEYITSKVPCDNASEAFAIGLLVYFFGIGFFSSYLMTALKLGQLLGYALAAQRVIRSQNNRLQAQTAQLQQVAQAQGARGQPAP